jgi:hypothetical protein
MADVVTTFTSDIKRVEADMQRMSAMNRQLMQELRQMRQETKQNKDAGNNWLGDQISSVKKLAGGYLTVQAALAFVNRTTEHWKQSLEAANKQATEINDKVIAAATATGDIINADRIKAFTQRAAIQGYATQADAATMYQQSSMGNPGATIARKEAIAGALLPQRALLSDEELGDYSKIAGKNAKLFGDAMPASEIADITLAMRAMAGMRFNELKDRDFDKGAYKLSASGAMSKEEGLAFAVSAVVNNQEAGIIERFANKIFDQKDKVQITPGMTAQQRKNARLENQYAAMSPADRYNALRTDDAMARAVLDSDYLNFKQLSQDVERITGELKKASAPGDYSGGKIAEAKTQAVVQERVQRTKIEALKSEAMSESEIRAGAIKRSTEFINAAIERNNPIGPDWLYQYSETANATRAAGAAPEDIADTLVKYGVATGTGLTKQERDEFVARERELVTKQLEAARAMKEAAEAMKGNGAAPARPLNVNPNRDKEGR